MADKTKSRNPDRRSGKAWSKKHDAPAKAKEEKKDSPVKKPSRTERGSNITYPRITWEWAGANMNSRAGGSQRLRMFDMCVARDKAGYQSDGSTPLVIEENPEAKTSRSSRKNGR